VIPGSLEIGEIWDIRKIAAQVRVWAKRYVWLWILYQTVKGILTTTVIWVPLLYTVLSG
jgi:hypothetical protein